MSYLRMITWGQGRYKVLATNGIISTYAKYRPYFWCACVCVCMHVCVSVRERDIERGGVVYACVHPTSWMWRSEENVVCPFLLLICIVQQTGSLPQPWATVKVERTPDSLVSTSITSLTGVMNLCGHSQLFRSVLGSWTWWSLAQQALMLEWWVLWATGLSP